MPSALNNSKSFFSFNLNEKLELNLKTYINSKKRQEISGGLIGHIRGGQENRIVFDIQHFLPFPNLARDPYNFVIPPNIWLDILEEWRTFYFNEYRFVGFLHTHPKSTSKISKQDRIFAKQLNQKYGSIVFIIIGKNKYLRCYLFRNSSPKLLQGNLKYFQCIEK